METTWRELLSLAMEENGESWDAVVGSTLTDEQLDKEFCDGFGNTNGCPFTLWTDNYVYFPACYDGSEWAASVPRNPCEVASLHIGGG